MKEIIDFLKRLEANNNREWFAEHKGEYLQLKEHFDGFAQNLIAGVREFDENIGPLTPKDCTYRIYRDTRFSPDKTPYKIHMGIFIVPGGKKSGYSGYYFQVGAHNNGFPGGCMLATGHYIVQPDILKLLREDIALDDGEEFQNALIQAPDFQLEWDSALKRVPQGFEPDKPYSDWLRLKNFCLTQNVDHQFMTAPDLLSRVLTQFRTTKPFLDFINRPHQL